MPSTSGSLAVYVSTYSELRSNPPFTHSLAGSPDPSKLCVKGGFDRSSEYVLTYTAKDPLVLGIGFAATRDLNSFLRYAKQANPLAGQIKWVISRGDSQSGNFIRSFIHLGFNQDEAGRSFGMARIRTSRRGNWR